MLTYNFNKDTKLPLYVVLYNHIKNDIENGTIPANTKLPSKRSLADHLKISVMTVQNAYAQLIAEGYIQSKERKGYYVCEISFVSKMQSADKNPEISLSDKAEDHYAISLCENRINSKNFPFSVWSKQMRQVISEKGETLLCQSPNIGLLSLRQAISSYLYKFRGMIVDANHIVIGAGAEYLYSLIIKLLGRDKIYGIEDPGYRKIAKIYNTEGIAIKYIPLDSQGLMIKNLEDENVEIMYTSPSHNYPTGIVMSIKRRHEILRWLHQAKGRYIIEDEYDSEFRFEGKPIPSLKSNDASNIIYLNTFSKTIAPSLRISYMILTPELAQKYTENLGFYSCPVCSFEQETLARFISNGSYERHINRMRRLYKQKRNYILDLIKNSRLGSIDEEMSGLHFILKLNTDKSDRDMKELAMSQGLKISFLSDYCLENKEGISSKLIVNYSGIENEDIKEAIHILKHLL